MTKHPLLFIDWDGTLSDNRFWEPLKQKHPNEYDRIQYKLFNGNNSLVDAWMRGEHRSEQVCGWLSEYAEIPYERLWAELVSSCEEMRFRNEFRILIRSLRERFHIVLATDNMDCFSRFTVPALKLHSLFDDMLISSDLKMLKGDGHGKLFSSYIQNIGSDIANALFIDNSPSACSVFESLGGRAIKTEGIKDTIRHLKSGLS